jgi:hypothetical protein
MLLRSVLSALAVAVLAGSAAAAPLRIEATLAPGIVPAGPLTGRLLVAISKDDKDEPRNRLIETYDSQQVFGVDVKDAAARTLTVDATANGFPLARLSDLPAGDYWVQAVFNRYDRFKRGDGQVLDLPADRGEGQHWNRKPGNPYSAPMKVHLSADGGVVRLTLDKVAPAVRPDPDTALLKHVHVRNARLSRFWGRDVYLDAFVLLPAGWAEHPQARYPVVVYQDHFSSTLRALGGWRETPPGPELKDKALMQARAAYVHYLRWSAGAAPKVIVVQVNHANPYYDDSYAVNSANIGPYGDAINLDLIPAIEAQFHGIGEGWARTTFGGSTGGWEALATQIFYPDAYNGAWASCPDSLDFHTHQAANLYDDTNAYVRQGPFGSIEVVADRASDGEITATMGGVNHYELALGTHGRSAEQFDAWQAVFSPVGPDGYPAAVYDKQTGVIDKRVVAYWRDHYDLTFIVKRDWASLGPRLEGKLHVAVGDADTYFLNNGVHRFEAMLRETRGPHSDATFDYGPRAPHCYTGATPDWAGTAGISAFDRELPEMVAHMLATAPSKADVASWRY